LILCVLAQFGIKGRIAAGKKPFDGERPRVSSRLNGFSFSFKTTSYEFYVSVIHRFGFLVLSASICGFGSNEISNKKALLRFLA
jgi:hypothetical protein